MIKHTYQSGTANDATDEVSSTRWNEDHTITDFLELPSVADPAVPAANKLRLYAKSIAGKMLPKTIGPSGIDTVLQSGLSGNSVFMLAPANGTTAPTAMGGNVTAATTISHLQTIASANPWQATRRWRHASLATAGAVSGVRMNNVQYFLGNAAGFGGFFFRAQFGQNINLAGGQLWCGLSAAGTGALAGDPSALLNMIGMGYDTADANTGNWFLMRNDGAGTATKVDLGANAVRNTTHGYDLVMHAKPNSAEIFVRVVNLHSNVVVLDTSYTTDIPALNTGMAFSAQCRNGAVAAAVNIEVAKLYIESDY